MKNELQFESFIDLFSECVASSPSETSVVYNKKRLSYSELDNLSSQFAAYLVNNGVKQGDIVGLAIYNSLDLIAGILGIWKAKGVFLPIDPNYPKKRVDEIIEDAKPKFVLTSKEVEKRLSLGKEQILLFDSIHSLSRFHANVDGPLNSSSIAYIMYTSGSTGRPKGIVVSHRALAHAAKAYTQLHPNSYNALVSGSISFDPSLLTILHTLSNNGTISLYNNHNGIDIDNPNRIIEIINSNQISFLLSTPSFYSKILSSGIPLPSLKNVDLCGECISEDLLKKHTSLAPGADLYNAYGPTEYAIGATASKIYSSSTKATKPVTIGKGFSENKAYILDPRMRPVKAGEKGEICIAGPGLAEGYLNQDALTNEKFVVLTNIESNPVKVYRTGDVGQSLKNGDIIFSGRTDHQVKINGHRVELEEIEQSIGKFPGIEQVAVTLKSISPSKNHLIAFYTSQTNIAVKELKNYLLKRLPSYMLPAQFQKMNSMPTTSNGKVDRAKLQPN